MGGKKSTPAPPQPCKPPSPPPSPLFGSPWRDVFTGGKRERNLQYANDYQPKTGEVSRIRILVYGAVGHGKSSFINSVSSTLRGRICIPTAASATTSDRSFTKKYRSHEIKKDNGEFYPFVFNDIMGLEETTGCGVSVEDIKLAMSGHVKEGYKFNPVSPLSPGDPDYNPSPSPDDRVHVLICVHSANASEIKASVLQKMKSIREAASDIGIPQLAVITKMDEACDETENDLKNVYRSKYVKKKMTDFSSEVGIPLNCILPVKNYSEENETNEMVDTLILSALKVIIDFGDDFIDKLPTTACS